MNHKSEEWLVPQPVEVHLAQLYIYAALGRWWYMWVSFTKTFHLARIPDARTTG